MKYRVRVSYSMEVEAVNQSGAIKEALHLPPSDQPLVRNLNVGVSEIHLQDANEASGTTAETEG